MSRTGIHLPELRVPMDYGLTGVNSSLAIERGMAEADWYQSPAPRATMRKLLERKDGPALRDTLLCCLLLFVSGAATFALWPSWWAALPYAVYSVLYASVSDSRWHEAGYGAASKTDWMNDVLYEIASFMIVGESTVWRWSYTRHHSDTIIVGRDPEIAAPRPPDFQALLANFFCLWVYPKYFKHLALHCLGRIPAEERTFIPDSEFAKVYRTARIYALIYAATIALAITLNSLLPLLLVCFPNLFGTWLTVVYGFTQHAGLAEDVLDHRLNCRTMYMNSINRYLYSGVDRTGNLLRESLSR
jgi:Na+-transporting NADH:ubiquinone oxidoreductase subunit F